MAPRKRKAAAETASAEETASAPLDTVERLMLEFSSNYVVSKKIVEEFHVTERTARRWISEVRDAWRRELDETDIEADRAFYRANLLDLYAQAKAAGNLPIALSALKRYAEFNALDKPQIQHVEHHVSPAEDVSRWEPATAIEYLRSKGVLPDLVASTERGDGDA